MNLTSFGYAEFIGRTLRRAHEFARERLKRSHQHQKDVYNKTAFGSPYQEGDLVYVKEEVRTLSPFYNHVFPSHYFY